MNLSELIESQPPATTDGCDALPRGAAGDPSCISTSSPGGSLPIEAFKLGADDKWKRMTLDEVRNMRVSHLCLGPWLLKQNGLYYCGNDAVYRKLEDKGDSRKWLHDFVIDRIKEYKEDWLQGPVRSVIEI